MLLPRVKEFRKYSNIIFFFFFILSRLNTVTSDHLFTFVINSISICVRCVMGLNTRSFYSERRPKDNNDPETCLALDLLTSLSCTMTAVLIWALVSVQLAKMYKSNKLFTKLSHVSEYILSEHYLRSNFMGDIATY